MKIRAVARFRPQTVFRTAHGRRFEMFWILDPVAAISGDLLSAVISIRYIFGFRKDNPNVFNSLIQSWPHF
jgi:hypothetical protein